MGCLLRGCVQWPQPYNFFCEPPDRVRDEFHNYSQGKERMTVQDFTRFMRDCQGEKDVQEEDVKRNMEQFIRGLMESSKSSRHLKILGLRSYSSIRGSRSLRIGSRSLRIRSGSSRASKKELLAAEQSERESTFTLPLFLKFLLSPAYNNHNAGRHKRITDNMEAPLSDYFIFSSHNTYLTGNQVTSPSSTEAIENALKSGCRVIELDCWPDDHGTIKVTHGNTLTSKIGLEDCIQEIKEHAFSASDYPVIVNIENHLTPELQKVAAKMLKRILADDMFYPITARDRRPKAFLSPEFLKRKIIISDKPPSDSVVTQVVQESEFTEEYVATELRRSWSSGSSAAEDESVSWRGGKKSRKHQIEVVADPRSLSLISGHEDQNGSHEEPKDPEFEDLLYIDCLKPTEMEEPQESRGPLRSGQYAIMANLSEAQVIGQIRVNPTNLIKYAKTNLVRVYPFGLRVFSTNADPMIAWRHGVQVAAINMQGRDRAVWISKALFSKNGGSGYVKKPEVLLPKSTLTVEDLKNLPPKLELKVTVLMGTDWDRHYDILKKPDYFVKVAVHGMFGDAVKRTTKIIPRSREPHWNQEFEFLIRVPELAILRLEVKEHDTFCREDFVGQSCVPVTDIQQGIRVVHLKSKKGEPRKAKLLCHFSMRSLPAEETPGLLQK